MPTTLWGYHAEEDKDEDTSDSYVIDNSKYVCLAIFTKKKKGIKKIKKKIYIVPYTDRYIIMEFQIRV